MEGSISSISSQLQLHLQRLGVCAEFSYSSVHYYRTEERAKQGIKQPRGGKSGESRVNKTGYETDYDSDYTAYD
jgi:hypothetical protein